MVFKVFSEEMRKAVLYRFHPSAYPSVQSVCVDSIADNRALLAYDRLRSARQNREITAATIKEILSGESCTGNAESDKELAALIRAACSTRSKGSKTKSPDDDEDVDSTSKSTRKSRKKKAKLKDAPAIPKSEFSDWQKVASRDSSDKRRCFNFDHGLTCNAKRVIKGVCSFSHEPADLAKSKLAHP